MRILGFNITRTKAAPGTLSGIDNRGQWWPIIKEAMTGDWQKNIEVRLTDVLSDPVTFRCISMISSDIAKIRLRLVERDGEGIWSETTSPAFSPVLRKPNRYQNRIQFITSWMQSKLTHGNAFILKERDNRNVVVRLYVLDPSFVTVLVSPDGGVYYRLNRDDLSGVFDGVTVPASEMIHDRWNTFYHPLVGLSPLYASGISAVQGLNIRNFVAKFFRNNARPGGILSAPAEIDEADAKRIKEFFEANFGGDNAGKVAVLGSNLQYKPMSLTMQESEMSLSRKASAEDTCTAFGVPPYKIGIGDSPSYDNIAALNQRYYEDTLQRHYEDIELCLDEGIELPDGYGTEFDVDDLLRLDFATQVKTLGEGVKSALIKPDEGRRRLNLRKVKGGDAVYLQQQNFSLEALAKRDASDDPFASSSSSGNTPPAGNKDNPQPADQRAAIVSHHATQILQRVKRNAAA